jgi:hypothetical protein
VSVLREKEKERREEERKRGEGRRKRQSDRDWKVFLLFSNIAKTAFRFLSI